jgi:nitrogen fixation protein NifU and related proteins
MNLDDIYTELIMEHNKSKKNKRPLIAPDIIEKGHNPSCGDEIEINIKFDGDIIKEISFTGVGCAISQASASIMCDLITGKTKKEALELTSTFIAMIKKEIEDEEALEILEDAIIFKNLSNMPARVKCGVLCWHTLSNIV